MEEFEQESARRERGKLCHCKSEQSKKISSIGDRVVFKENLRRSKKTFRYVYRYAKIFYIHLQLTL